MLQIELVRERSHLDAALEDALEGREGGVAMSGDFVDGGGGAFLQRRGVLAGSTRRSLSRVDALLSMPYVFDSIDRSSLATERKLAAPRFISISAALAAPPTVVVALAASASSANVSLLRTHALNSASSLCNLPSVDRQSNARGPGSASAKKPRYSPRRQRVLPRRLPPFAHPLKEFVFALSRALGERFRVRHGRSRDVVHALSSRLDRLRQRERRVRTRSIYPRRGRLPRARGAVHDASNAVQGFRHALRELHRAILSRGRLFPTPSRR